MIRLRIRGGVTYTGRSVTTIVRRKYGTAARFWPSRNPESPEGGVIVSPADAHDPGTFHVLAEVLDVEEVEP